MLQVVDSTTCQTVHLDQMNYLDFVMMSKPRSGQPPIFLIFTSYIAIGFIATALAGFLHILSLAIGWHSLAAAFEWITVGLWPFMLVDSPAPSPSDSGSTWRAGSYIAATTLHWLVFAGLCVRIRNSSARITMFRGAVVCMTFAIVTTWAVIAIFGLSVIRLKT